MMKRPKPEHRMSLHFILQPSLEWVEVHEGSGNERDLHLKHLKMMKNGRV